jgi:hypothetical protein
MKESIILYGPENSLKYKKATELILPYSKSKLKYKRKIEIVLNGEIYYYNISDVHFEIDFELLGTNEHGLWYEFISQVSAIVQTQPEFSIILCRNFHLIDQELLSIFYTFMRNPKIKFILCTKHISFLPASLKEICQIVALKKHSSEAYGLEYKPFCDKIVSFILEQDDLFHLRELIYQLSTYNFDIHNCLRYIYFEMVKAGLKCSMDSLIPIITRYNTKYRSIYHLEMFILHLKLNL